VSESCRCGRRVFARAGDLEATCGGCRLKPDLCPCADLTGGWEAAGGRAIVKVRSGYLDGKATSAAVAEPAEGKDAFDHLAAGRGLGESRPVGDGDSTTADGWERPAPLGGHPDLPAFPVDAFPDWVRAEVEAVAEFTQTPADLGATVALAVLSTAAGGRAVVEVRGSWREPVNLYTVAALPSGSRKSAVFAQLTEPLLATELGLVDKTGPQIVESATLRKIAQKDAEKTAAMASGIDKGVARDRALADAIAAAQLAEAITVPVMPRLVADDITPEAAASLLAEQGGRLAVLSAEGGIFAVLAGRYSGGVPSLEVFLKGHSGDMLRVDRKGRPPEHVPHPALTLGLCVQPEVLRAIAAMPGFRGRGLLARILYSLPPNLVGHRKTGTAAGPDEVQDTYAANVRALVLTFAEWTDPAVLPFTPAAAELILAAEQALEPRLDPETGDLASIVDWASKQIGATVRIAGLLHLARYLADGWGRPIGEDTMADAIRITDYYTAHALAAFDHMGVDPVLADARVLHHWIERTGLAKFTKRELFTGVSRSRFPKVGGLDVPLDLLEQHGYIRRLPEPEREGPGRRPSPAYLVHPDLAAETTESAQ
jgi:replicative DNA helicase